MKQVILQWDIIQGTAVETLNKMLESVQKDYTLYQILNTKISNGNIFVDLLVEPK